MGSRPPWRNRCAGVRLLDGQVPILKRPLGSGPQGLGAVPRGTSRIVGQEGGFSNFIYNRLARSARRK